MGFDSKSLPDSFRKCIAKDERERTPEFATSQELSDKQAVKAEKEMHATFSNWCRVNNLPFIHSRMDRKPTIREFWPDYTVISGRKVCCIEFKVGSAKPSEGQWAVINELIDQGTPVLVSNDLSTAIKWTKEQLGL